MAGSTNPAGPSSTAHFRVRRTVRVAMLVVAMLLTTPLLRGFGAAVTGLGAAVIAVLAAIVLERLTRVVVVRDGVLVERKFFRTRRVSLRSLTQFKAVKVRSGSGTQKSDFTRFDLADAAGRQLSMWPYAVRDSERLTEIIAAWARHRRLPLDAETEAMVRFEQGGRLGGIFRETARLVWKARQSRNR